MNAIYPRYHFQYSSHSNLNEAPKYNHFQEYSVVSFEILCSKNTQKLAIPLNFLFFRLWFKFLRCAWVCMRCTLSIILIVLLWFFSEWFQHWSRFEWSSCQSTVWWCCWTNQCDVDGFNQHETCVGGKLSYQNPFAFSFQNRQYSNNHHRKQLQRMSIYMKLINFPNEKSIQCSSSWCANATQFHLHLTRFRDKYIKLSTAFDAFGKY